MEIGDDLIFGGPEPPSTNTDALPSENLFLGLLEGENTELVMIWPKAKQRLNLRFGEEAGKNRMRSVDFDTDGRSLYLAALSAPRASVQYLKRALEINPNSQKARRGMHWAIQRMRTSPDFQRPAFAQRREIVDHSIPSSNWIAPSAWYQSQSCGQQA